MCTGAICINSFETIPEYFFAFLGYNFGVSKAHNKNQPHFADALWGKTNKGKKK